MDPNPIKHTGGLLKRLRIALTPMLEERGFSCNRAETYGDYREGTKWIDFIRGDESLSIMCEIRHGRLLADFVNSRGAVVRLAQVGLHGSRTTPELLRRIDLFVNQVSDAIRRLSLVEA